MGTIPQPRFNISFDMRPNADWTYGFRTTFAFERDEPPKGDNPADAYQLRHIFVISGPRQGALENAVVRFGIDDVLGENYGTYPNDLRQPGRTF